MQANHPPFPDRIGPFKIEGILSKGGMSELYLGAHPQTNDPLAIKVLAQKYISNPEVVQRFLNEAEIIAITNHPNIVKMYGHGEWEGGLYIAMEYVEGISLRQYLLNTPLSLKRAVGIIIDIAYALCHLHTHGVIHRDLKPENILITDLGGVKVIDFGIAQLLSDNQKDSAGKPLKHRLIGTPIYMSPEQKDNPETVSFPSDIYSLGILCYELILGNLSEGHLHLSLMPVGMQPILQKCLLPNPIDRYQDIVDFITDVSHFMNSAHLHKEGILKDQINKIPDELFHIHDVLITEKPTDWKELEIGVAKRKHLLSLGSYYQFFRLKNHEHGLFFGEIPSEGIESFLHAATLKGALSTLFSLKLNFEELIEELRKLLLKQKICPVFDWSIVLFHPETQTISYTTFGKKNLWILKNWKLYPLPNPKKNAGPGFEHEAQIETATLALSASDLLLIASIPNVQINSQKELIQKFLQDHAPMPPQKFVENFLRTVRVSLKEQVSNHPITLITIAQRSEK